MNSAIDKLWNKNFILHLIAYELGDIGVKLLQFALSIHILMTTGDIALFATVLSLVWLPYVLLSLPGGILADRVSKRRIMVVCNVLIALAITVYIIFMGKVDSSVMPIAMLLALMTFGSIASASEESSLFLIVPSEKIMQANSISASLMFASGIVAPIIAGFILAQFGLSVIVYISLGIFLAVALLYRMMQIPFTKPEKKQDFFTTLKTDTQSSLKYIWSESKTTRSITIGIFLYALLFFPAMALVPSTLIYSTLGMDETSIGLSQGLIAVGSVLGTILINFAGARIDITKTPHLLIAGSVIQILMAVAFMMTNSQLLAYVIITGGLLLSSGILTMLALNAFTYFGQNTPEEIIGKVMALFMSVMFLGGTVSQFAVGRLFGIVGDNLVLAVLVFPVIVIATSFLTANKSREVSLGD